MRPVIVDETPATLDQLPSPLLEPGVALTINARTQPLKQPSHPIGTRTDLLEELHFIPITIPCRIFELCFVVTAQVHICLLNPIGRHHYEKGHHFPCAP